MNCIYKNQFKNIFQNCILLKVKHILILSQNSKEFKSKRYLCAEMVLTVIPESYECGKKCKTKANNSLINCHWNCFKFNALLWVKFQYNYCDCLFRHIEMIDFVALINLSCKIYLGQLRTMTSGTRLRARMLCIAHNRNVEHKYARIKYMFHPITIWVLQHFVY